MNKKKIGLALSTGGARGLSHIGVISTLQDNNIPIDYISGTSMGAIIAVYYALNLEVKSLQKLILNMTKRDYLKLIDINNPKKSIIKGNKIRNFLKKVFRNKSFTDTKIPLMLSATSLNDASLVILDKGKLHEAAMMSAAYPGVFPPIKYKGKYLIDGGVVDPCPIDLAFKMGAKKVIGVDLWTEKFSKDVKPNLRSTLERTFNILLTNLSIYKEKEYKKNVFLLKIFMI